MNKEFGMFFLFGFIVWLVFYVCIKYWGFKVFVLKLKVDEVLIYEFDEEMDSICLSFDI